MKRDQPLVFKVKMNGQSRPGYRRTSSNVSARSDDYDIALYEDDRSQPGGRKKLRRPLHTWSRDDVTKWLRMYHNRYHQLYSDIFEHHELTGRALIRLNSAKLERIGVTNPDHREDLLVQILRLQIKHQMKLLQKLRRSEQNPQ